MSPRDVGQRLDLLRRTTPGTAGTRAIRTPKAMVPKEPQLKPYSRPNAIAAQIARATTPAAITKRTMARTRPHKEAIQVRIGLVIRGWSRSSVVPSRT
jgi:hypothetical protein